MTKKIWLIMALVASAGCLQEKSVPETPIATVAEAEDDFQVIWPDGTITNGQAETELALAGQAAPVEEMQTLELTVRSTTPDAGAKKGLDLGQFHVSVLPDAGYLEGCIRHTFLHLKVLVTNTKIGMSPMIELHLVAWFDSAAPCFAVMNTGFIGYGWCQKMCLKDVKKGVAATVGGGLVAAGVAPYAASVISRLLAPVAAAALAL